MRKLIALLLTMCVAPGVFAQLNSNGEGFYRISSQQTKRYMSLESNRFTINNSGSIPKIDMSSLTTIEAGSNQSNIVSNPASVFYIKRSKGNEYDLMSQGVNTWEMSGQRYHLTIEGNNPYDIKAIGNYKSVYVNYAISENMEHIVTPHGSSVYKWNITPIKSSDANSFFGIIPQITSGSKYYSSFYASFAFNFASAGMKAWVVDYIDYNRNIAVVKEITGIVPSATPVIIECSSPTAASNKMNLYASGGTRPANNAMEGVFFCKTGKMENFVKYNSQTMRVLGLASDGSLAFVQAPSTQLYVPANTTYLKVNKGSAGEFKIMTWDEYNASTPGDLNGDGEVDVTDVVELIDMVLAGSTDPAGDINGDGEVDVTDVVELIDMVLAG